MNIILREKQISEAMVKELEKQRRIFRNSDLVKRRGLHNRILLYEVRVKNDCGYSRIYCDNFNDIPKCLAVLQVIPSESVEIIVYDNYFLEKLCETT